MSTERLTIDEALGMLDSMASQAQEDANMAEDDESMMRWDGWAEGLRTLKQHILTGVKASCFPMGTCRCHPVKIAGRS